MMDAREAVRDADGADVAIETWSNCCEANQPAVYAPTA